MSGRSRVLVARHPLRPWIVGWLGGAGIGIANGVLREATYAKVLGDRAGHQLSAVTAVGGFAAYFSWLQRRWPVRTDRDALHVGGVWLAATVVFEFGFGRLVAKQSWEELLRDYDVRSGRTWPLVLAWLALGPAISRRAARTARARSRPGRGRRRCVPTDGR